MDNPQGNDQAVRVIQAYNQEVIGYLQRTVFAESENHSLKEQLHQEQINSASTIQGLNDEIARLQQRINELQNGSSNPPQ